MDFRQTTIGTAVMGSHAYGLNHANSDKDLFGVFVLENDAFLGLNPVGEKALTNHKAVEGGDDFTYHELGKFCRLAAGGNPTVLESLFSDTWEFVTPGMQMLISRRHLFLSRRIRNSFCGYAKGQAKGCVEKGKFSNKDYAKHARHCFRLLQQGRITLETGDMVVRVPEDERAALMAVGELEPEQLYKKFEAEYERVMSVNSTLPDEPAYDQIDAVVRRIRTDLDRFFSL